MYTQRNEYISQQQQPLLSSKEALPSYSSMIKRSQEGICNSNSNTCKLQCIFNLVGNISLNLVRRELSSLLWKIKWKCRWCWWLKKMWCPDVITNGPSPRVVCLSSPQWSWTWCKDSADQTWVYVVQNGNTPLDITTSWNSKNPWAPHAWMALRLPNDLEGNL